MCAELYRVGIFPICLKHSESWTNFGSLSCDRLRSTNSFSRTRRCSVVSKVTKVSKTRSVTGTSLGRFLYTCRKEVNKRLLRGETPSNSSVRVPCSAQRPAGLPANSTRLSHDVVQTMLTLEHSPVLFLQNGFSGESLGRSPLVCVSAGLHHSRRLRGGQISQRVSLSSLRPETLCNHTWANHFLKKKKSCRF